jgi:hypothetical protein
LIKSLARTLARDLTLKKKHYASLDTSFPQLV